METIASASQFPAMTHAVITSLTVITLVLTLGNTMFGFVETSVSASQFPAMKLVVKVGPTARKLVILLHKSVAMGFALILHLIKFGQPKVARAGGSIKIKLVIFKLVLIPSGVYLLQRNVTDTLTAPTVVMKHCVQKRKRKRK